jgi:glutamyl-tRNA synthetase
MGITHVIRGEDHLSNTSKHTELFRAFGAPLPVYAHIPLILKQNGPGKMSKRDQGALIEEYQRRGYLSEALVNFLCLLGWSPKDDSEKLPIGEIIRLFDLPGVNQSNARFDEKKLAHMNMVYLLEQPADRFVALARDYFAKRADFLEGKANELAAVESAKSAILRSNAQFFRIAISDPAYFRDLMLIVQPKIKSLDEIVPANDRLESERIGNIPSYIGYFFGEKDAYPEVPGLRAKVMAKGDPKARLRELLELLPAVDFSHDGAIEEAIRSTAVKNGLGFGDYQAVARFAVSGTNVGPGIAAVFRVLGRERVLRRLARMQESN